MRAFLRHHRAFLGHDLVRTPILRKSPMIRSPRPRPRPPLLPDPPLQAWQLELRLLNVGQADASLVREGGKSALIDAGGGAGVLAQLCRLGVDTIDLLVASHNHAEHIGGMTAILGGSVVRFYLDHGVPHTTATYQRTIQAVTTSGAQYLRPTGRAITLGNKRFSAPDRASSPASLRAPMLGGQPPTDMVSSKQIRTARLGSGESWFDPRGGNFTGRSAFPGGLLRCPSGTCDALYRQVDTAEDKDVFR